MRPNFVYRAPPQYRAPQLYRPRPIEPYTLRWLYDRATEQYVVAPAGPYDDNSVFDTETEAGNIGVIKTIWSPSSNPLLIGADGIPYMDLPASGRQSVQYREYDRATSALVPVAGGGTTATYYINNAVPVLGTIPEQFWLNGIDSYADLDISDADDILSTLTITGTISGTAITGTYNARGVRVVLHTYLSGEPGEFQKWRLEFSLASGSGSSSGTISNLAVTDPLGAVTTFAAFNWTRSEGVQVPDVIPGDVLYADFVATLLAAGLSATVAIPVASGAALGTVTRTDPAYPSYVAAGSLISVFVSSYRFRNQFTSDRRVRRTS